MHPHEQSVEEPLNSWRRRVKRIGLIAGPCLALVSFWSLPTTYQDATGELATFSVAGRATLAMMLWMAIWWLTEAIDLYATALLPLVAFPLLGIATMESASAPYANPLIFLFMGGFLQALSMRRWGLDKRIALLTLRFAGTKPANMVAGFMLVTAVLSAFVSNTATTAMMLPIAMSVVALASSKQGERPDDPNFGTCLMLGIAYAASIGGLATIIGTPPNVFLVSFLQNSIAEQYRIEISFAKWMLIGVPLAVVFLPLVWVLLTRALFPIRMEPIEGGRQLVLREYKSLGPPGRGECVTFLVFVTTAIVWITRPWLANLQWDEGGNAVKPFSGLTDAGIAMTGALLLFVIPVRRKSVDFVMNWQTARELPWGILILFGGGLSLAAAVQANGVAEFVGSQSQVFAGIPDFLLVMIICVVVVFLTELTSNTATAATLLPVLAAMAPGMGIHPWLLVIPTAMVASCAFMLPVATPPNAIVFASGQVTIPQMMKAGLWLNMISVILITLLTFLIVAPLLGIE